MQRTRQAVSQNRSSDLSEGLQVWTLRGDAEQTESSCQLNGRILSVADFSVRQTHCQQKFAIPGPDSIELPTMDFRDREYRPRAFPNLHIFPVSSLFITTLIPTPFSVRKTCPHAPVRKVPPASTTGPPEPPAVNRQPLATRHTPSSADTVATHGLQHSVIPHPAGVLRRHQANHAEPPPQPKNSAQSCGVFPSFANHPQTLSSPPRVTANSPHVRRFR